MQPFVPQELPPVELDWRPLIPLIGRANRALASYAGILHAVPNPAVLLSPLTTQEAVLSARIEGTQATLGEVLKFEAGEHSEEPERDRDIQEILNYRRALRASEAELSQRPFSLSMLQGLHQMLLDGVRGDSKTPGRFRTDQNWIGIEGSPIEDAAFVPPSPLHLREHLEDWERFYRSEQPDPLVHLGVVHAQFEILHPFRDGNGRLGRVLIPLFLYEKGLLERPMFYLSAWLERHRGEYVSKLRALGRTRDSWNSWCEFFLKAVEGQAAQNSKQARAILGLYERLKTRVLELTHSQYAVPLLDQAFRAPVFKSTQLEFGPPQPSRAAVASLLRVISAGGILKVLKQGAGRRPTIYALAELIDICESSEVL